MRVIIHAGLPKTGSSALQEYLYSHRSELAELDLVYPDLGHQDHWMIAAAMAKNPMNFHHAQRRLEAGERKRELQNALGAFRKIAEGTKPGQTLITSHEGYSIGESPSRLVQFFREVDVDSAVTFIAYARDPVEHYASAVQQVLKNDRARSFAPSSWVSPHIARIDSLLKVGASLIVRPHSRSSLDGGDVVTDFFGILHRLNLRTPDDPSAARGTNSSLTAKACAVLHLTRQLDTPAKRMLLRRAVRAFDRPEFGPKLTSPDSWRMTIEATNARPWNRTMRRLQSEGMVASARLLDESARSTAVLTDKDVDHWLESAFDPDYVERLRDRLAGKKTSESSDNIAVRDYLGRLIERTRQDRAEPTGAGVESD